jgi:hypothetical protein
MADVAVGWMKEGRGAPPATVKVMLMEVER